MHVQRLWLNRFRLFEEREIHFSPCLNVLYGANGSGKTSLLEALYLAGHGSSFRTHRLHELFPLGEKGEKSVYLEVDYLKCNVEQQLRLQVTSQQKCGWTGSGQRLLLHELVGGLLSLAVTPASCSLVKGLPQQRREFLDQLASQLDPSYHHFLLRYQRGIKQRNSLLRQQGAAELLACWEVETAHAASYLLSKRIELLEALQREVVSLSQAALGFSAPIELHYRASLPLAEGISRSAIAELLVRLWHTSRERDLALGYTTVGPHRDEFTAQQKGRSLRAWGSEGELHAASVSLFLGAYQLMGRWQDELPLLLIDDPFGAMDQRRSAALIAFLRATTGQVVIATPELTPLLEESHAVAIG